MDMGYSHTMCEHSYHVFYFPSRMAPAPWCCCFFLSLFHLVHTSGLMKPCKCVGLNCFQSFPHISSFTCFSHFFPSPLPSLSFSALLFLSLSPPSASTFHSIFYSLSLSPPPTSLSPGWSFLNNCLLLTVGCVIPKQTVCQAQHEKINVLKAFALLKGRKSTWPCSQR